MAKYLYICENEDCECSKASIEITKAMINSSRIELCELCESELKRIYTAVGISTFGDGYKS